MATTANPVRPARPLVTATMGICGGDKNQIVDLGDGTFKMKGTDYHNEAQVKAMLARGACGSCKFIDCGNIYLGVKLNWVTSVMAIFITWGFAIWCLSDEDNAPTHFGGAKTWVSQNFTWLYIRK